MWVSEDGRINTAAIPTEYVWDLPGVREFAPDTGSFAEWEIWRDGGLGDQILAEAEAAHVGASPAEETVFQAEAVPDDLIVRFPWGEVTDPASAEQALRDIPVRWRLDLALIVEDLVDDLTDDPASPST